MIGSKATAWWFPMRRGSRVGYLVDAAYVLASGITQKEARRLYSHMLVIYDRDGLYRHQEQLRRGQQP